MLRIAICDDHIQFCEHLTTMLQRLAPALNLKLEIDVFYSGEKLLSQLPVSHVYDIILLDIEMDGIDGVTVGKRIRDEIHDESTQIIYVSSNEQYVFELFQARPMGFLIKPVQPDKLKDMLRNALDLLHRENTYFLYQVGAYQRRCLLRDILYFESIRKKIRIVTQQGMVEYYGRFGDILRQIKHNTFVQVHRSYIVNCQHIIHQEYHHVIMSDHTTIHIGQTRRKAVRDTMTQIIKETEAILR